MGSGETISSVTRNTIEAYFDGFNSRDLSRMPIANEVYFKAPVHQEPIIGLDALRPFLENVFSQFERIDVQRTIVEGEFACVMLDYYLPGTPPTPMVDLFRVVDEEVIEILSYFDTKLIPT